MCKGVVQGSIRSLVSECKSARTKSKTFLFSKKIFAYNCDTTVSSKYFIYYLFLEKVLALLALLALH